MDIASLVASAEPFLGKTLLLTTADIRPDLPAESDAALRHALADAGWSNGARVAYISVYNKDYPRTRTLLEQLRRIGVHAETFFCSREPVTLVRSLLRLRRSYDMVIVGFRGQEVMPLVRWCLGRRKGIVFDAFVAISDTCADRGLVRESGVLYRGLVRLDRWLCGLADAVLVDTKTHAAFFQNVIGCPHVHAVSVEADARFLPVLLSQPQPPYILWYGTCLPLHGVEKILQWARCLEGMTDVRFLLIGPLTRRQRAMARVLSNVEVRSRVSPDALPALIHASALCLGGPFGDSGKAKRVIAGKTYQMLACGKPVLVSDTPANQELLSA